MKALLIITLSMIVTSCNYFNNESKEKYEYSKTEKYYVPCIGIYLDIVWTNYNMIEIFFDKDSTFCEVYDNNRYKDIVLSGDNDKKYSIPYFADRYTKYRYIEIYDNKWDKVITNLVFKIGCDTIFIVEKTAQQGHPVASTLKPSSNDYNVCDYKKKIIKQSNRHFFDIINDRYTPRDSIFELQISRVCTNSKNINVILRNKNRTDTLRMI